MGHPLVDRASELLKNGKASEAAALARQAVDAEPDNAEAHNTLGTALAQLGDKAGAERAYLGAAKADPNLYKPHANLATLYLNAGQLEMAVARLRHALALAPELTRLWLRLGSVLVQAGVLPEAEQVYKRAIAQEDNVAARGALASLYLRIGSPSSALGLLVDRDLGADATAHAALVEACVACNDERLGAAIDRAAAVAFRHDEAVMIARLALEHARFESATALARTGRAAADDPWNDEDVLLESACLEAVGLREEALDLLESAFSVRPSVVKAVTIGDTAQRSADVERAVAPLQAARVLFPDAADILVAWGRLCRARRDFDGAKKSFEAALRLDPDHADAVFGLGVAEATLLPSEEAVRLLDKASRLSPANPAPLAALLFAELHAGVWSPAERLERHRSFARRFCQVVQTAGPHEAHSGDRKLRVGYLSADFRDHAIIRFLEGMLGAHDTSRFEVFVYASVASPDGGTRRIAGLPLTFRDIHALADSAAARLIAGDRIDVLVVLDGHTSGARLRVAAYRPAPVLVSYLGYPGTLGLDAVDYRITDAVADPPGAEEHYSESLIRLEHSAWCFAPAPDLPTDRVGDETIRFATFNRSAKLSPQLVACFGEILRRLPGSRLALKAPTSESAELRARILSMLGDDVASRVELVPFTPGNEEHLRGYQRVDVALDTFPYAGTTTTCEALWMGVPVVTLAGATHVERVGASLLREVGLDRCVASTPEEYVARAVEIANDQALRQRLRRELRAAMKSRPLADPAAFTRSFERALVDLATRPRSPEPPAGTRLVSTDIGAKIVVPDNLTTATTFVLIEQQRWFEDEVPFVRALVQPGDLFVDIGANLGVYTIEAARLGARVVAFEPAERTASMLRASISLNGLTDVTVHQVALGGREGTAQLVHSSGPELSRLGGGPGPSEEVFVKTLDAFSEGLRGMKIVKLDAEGSEQAIVEASAELFRANAPVVMFELRHGNNLNLGLLDAFGQLGFGLYRLFPGLGMLGPFDRNGELDSFQLNLFALRPERVAELSGRGLLAPSPAPTAPSATDADIEAWVAARPLLRQLGKGLAAPAALRHHVAAHDGRLPAPERYAAAVAAEREALAELARTGAPEARLTASRTLRDLGWRVRAREMLLPLDSPGAARLHEPASLFCCALAEYEELDTFDPSVLYRAQAIEAQIRLGAYSSIYQKPTVLSLVADFYRAGGRSAQMDRRLGLLIAKSRALT
ncbi:MAG: FkbM family methyltransferase [Myxococcales bacterium]|nr:FkbM family methyltransferase [Myxococcales bacterium]